MDEILLPDEDEVMDLDSAGFQSAPIAVHSGGDAGKSLNDGSHPSGVSASDYVKITFARFVALVGNHSFVEVIEKNGQEEVILSANLLTDLANSKRFSPNTKGPLMVLGGVLAGILIGYILFKL